MSVQDTIKETITANDVVLYMNGTRYDPQCAFSRRVTGILNFIRVDYEAVNVLANAKIRQGIQEYSDSPTLPQLYIKGAFIGSCDHITKITLSGAFDELLTKNGIDFDKDAANKMREANR